VLLLLLFSTKAAEEKTELSIMKKWQKDLF